MTKIREARSADDAALAGLDASIETPLIYTVVRTDGGFELSLTQVNPPLKKEYPLAHFRDMAPATDYDLIAERDGRIVGFIGTAVHRRSKRCLIWHFYVDKAHRRQGIGRLLMDAVEAHCRNIGARLMWVETQNVNAPAIAAYRALGFELCGLDTALYQGTPEEGETALYFARQIGEPLPARQRG
ncbi:MAG TPA: GNAT family N-acetyltransferase [Alphaproteobacteria bacterium]|nr:GNAT family N-acetyltransferase [Alphaproteobacteria bacterium]